MRSRSAIAEPGLLACADPEEIRSHLARVTGSREFVHSPRLARFLAFVVETTLAGQRDQIKESLIAVEVYGRRPDYNPQVDSTVRVEAGRLRARLRQYYDAGGQSEPLEIVLPKGSYVPVFQPRPSIAAAPVDVPLRENSHRSRRLHALAAAALLGVCAALFIWPRTRDKSDAIESLAVLPFVNLSGGAATDGFCDGLTEELTTALGREAQVRVASRTTMARYKHSAVDVARVGKDHNVRAVLEGSVRRDGDRIIVTAQLIDTTNGYHLWADRYDGESPAAAGAQNRVAARIAARLDEVLQGRRGHAQIDEQTMAVYHRAHDLLRIPVLKNGAPEKLPDTVLEAVRLFREVTARSPEFGKGWAGFAEAAEWEYELRGNQPRERLAEAKAAALRAVEVEPELVEGWTILTSILLFREWDFKAAEVACRRSIELDPRNVSARQRYTDILRAQGRHEDARFEIEQAIKAMPAAAALRVRRALVLYQAHEYDQALAEARAAAELTNQIPVYPMALWVEGLALEQQGKYSDAERVFKSALALQPRDLWNEPALGHLLALTRRRAEAEAILSDLRSQAARGRMTYVSQALVHTAFGQTDEALLALEQGLTERDDAVPFVALDPRFRPLHSQPRFRALVARANTASRS
jgi:TolB-like protein/Flp pilus assembly protein TadD